MTPIQPLDPYQALEQRLVALETEIIHLWAALRRVRDETPLGVTTEQLYQTLEKRR